MVTAEREVRPNPENGNIRVADPAELMRDNPAALIVNTDSYTQMAAHFSPDQFDPPQIVKVVTYSSEHGEVVRDYVLDGLTRTKFVNDNYDSIIQAHPEFKFRVRDVTASILQNPAIVPLEEKTEGQQALIMPQFLRGVIGPTKEHSQIASDRIAAHIINGWNTTVGPELARKYSALAALSLLANPSINIATGQGLRRDLDRQEHLMAEEEPKERKLLQEKLEEMGALIRQARLDRRELAQAAFMLVTTESPVIGGERESRLQIYGLLHMAEVERKLTQAFPDIGQREQMRDQLGQSLSDAYKSAGRMPNRQEVTNVLADALRDQQLSFDNALDVFTAPNPVERYTQVRQEVNRDRLSRVYLSSYRLDSLNPVESALIERLGARTNLPDSDIQGLTAEINSTNRILRRAVEFRTQITEQRDHYLASGVSRQLLDEAISKAQAAQEAINGAGTLQRLRTANRNLVAIIDDHISKMNNQMTRHTITGMVDDRIAEIVRTRTRSEIIDLVFGEFREITPENQERVQERIQQYASLDTDLFDQVRDAHMSRSTALQRQQQRNRDQAELERRRAAQAAAAAAPTTPAEHPAEPPVEFKPPVPAVPPEIRVEPPVIPPATETPPVPIQQPIDVKPSAPVESKPAVPPAEPKPATPVQPTIPPEQPGVLRPVRQREIIVDPAQLEQQRIRINLEKLDRWIDNVGALFNQIDLRPEELPQAVKDKFDSFLRPIERLNYGHPDTPRVMRQEYHRLLRENNRLLAALLQNEQERAQGDTRTRQ